MFKWQQRADSLCTLDETATYRGEEIFHAIFHPNKAKCILILVLRLSLYLSLSGCERQRYEGLLT